MCEGQLVGVMCERPGSQIESASPATSYAICIGMTIAGLIALFLGCAKRRSEQALAEARMRRESLDLQDPDYGGVLIEQIAEERAIELRIMQKSASIRRPALESKPAAPSIALGSAHSLHRTE